MANKEKDRLYERLPDLDYRFDMREYEAFIEDMQGEYETDPAQTVGRCCSTASPPTCR